MRKLTLLMASCIMVFGVFGQKKIQKLNLPSPQVQLLNTAPYTYGYEELSQQLIDNAPRTPSGHI
ncbi:MAG: hypothetical protein KDD29_06170, partial [Flavobacteriales bacterium]|nr:hypothetical protein [Flavobacteriales bacterium]